MFFERADERKQGVKECGKEALHFFFMLFFYCSACINMYSLKFLQLVGRGFMLMKKFTMFNFPIFILVESVPVWLEHTSPIYQQL